MKNILFFLIFFATQYPCDSNAGQLKVRAREHFEIHKIKTTNADLKYKGLSNTINIWYEKPYEYSLGLSFSPVISSLRADATNTVFGDEIKLINIGIEFKYHLNKILRNSFTRLGVGQSTLKSDLANDLSGNFYYLGLGYEVPFEKFGLALEMAMRSVNLDNGVEVESITPSIGFHFYKNI